MAGYTIRPEELNDRVDQVIGYYPILRECYARPAWTMSGGERQMLAIAMALIRQPSVMLFDEPTANLSPKISTEVINEIVKLKDDLGKTIVLVEQNAVNALKCGQKALLLVSGRIAFDGESNDLLNSPELGQLYLGLKS
jgi:branched-chain amino acid transport system ATP-binding protein